MTEHFEDAVPQPQPGERLTVPKRNNAALGCGCLGLLTVAITIGLVIAGNKGESDLSSGSAPAATQAAAPVSSPAVGPAQMLADLDGDKSPVADYQAAIDALKPKCTQDETTIAGLGDAGYKDLVKNGVTDETRLSVLKHLNESIPASLGKTDCTGMLSAYLVLREG